MDKYITGFLIFKKPNTYTTPSTASPSLHMIPIYMGFLHATSHEVQAVGTRCGSIPFNQERVNEYTAYKMNKKTMESIIFQNEPFLNNNELNDSTWRQYYNNQMRRWFGDDLIDMY